MLAAEERAQLLNFVNQSPPGTPYLRRAKIILLDDDGATQEDIAAEVQVPITRVRQMLRAYKREGARLFPDFVWTFVSFRADDPITDVARHIIADLAAGLGQYEAALATETDMTAVHESRKTTRKMRTALHLFEPFFQDRVLQLYRKRARKFMRRLSLSRDTAVLLLRLDAFILESYESDRLSEQDRLALIELADYWRGRQFEADEQVRRFLADGKYQRLLADLGAFGRGDTGQAVQDEDDLASKAAYIAPVLIYQKLGHVRAMGDRLEDLRPERLHALRITCKELRYTLEFFEGLLGPGASECLETVKRLLIHLGDVNDARVHLRMLDQVDEPDLADAIGLYRGVIADQLQQLRESFPSLWAEFDRPDWRQRLASAVAVL
ncbi:MAG: CHAD domain-containing protein [Chloroflexota bacterium]|jgi:CHAD domain-containing protein